MLAWGVAIGIGLGVLWLTRGMTFISKNTDAEKQVRTASQASRWAWPSHMHQDGSRKALMKDASVLCLVLFQRLLGDRKGLFPVTALCAFSHCVSSVLLFFVAKGYWGEPVGWFLFALYLVSFWPYQVILLGGYQGVAQMFFLASVLCLQKSPSSFFFTALSGFWTGCMMFSSASARKFLPLVMGAFLFAHQGEIAFPGSTAQAIAGALLLTLGLLLFPWKVRNVPEGEPAVSERVRVRRSAQQLGLTIGLSLLLPAVFARSFSLLIAEWAVVGGVSLAVLFFTYPRILYHVKLYLYYWNSQQLHGHFPLYREYFIRMGKPIPSDMRGAGFRWVLRFLWLIVPFHLLLWVCALVFLVFHVAAHGLLLRESMGLVGIILLSISPILVGELTGSAQVARAYLPALPGLLLLIGEGCFRWRGMLTPHDAWIFSWGAAWFLLPCVAWNLWVFFSDVWPCRMAPYWMAKRLLTLQAGPFYTYATPYNHSLVGVFPEEIRSRLTIHPIRSLEEVGQGYAIVPGTSSKSLTMESETYVIKHGDFREDPVLNELIESRGIERFAVASLKTLGSSRFWVQESDVASYRDLILREITEKDHFLGRAWILDAGRLASDRVGRKTGEWSHEASVAKGVWV